MTQSGHPARHAQSFETMTSLAVEGVISELVSACPVPVLRENTAKVPRFGLETTIGRWLSDPNLRVDDQDSLAATTGKIGR